MLDLQSHNGTRVNEISTQRTTLTPGDVIGIGPFQLRVLQLPTTGALTTTNRSSLLSVSDDGRLIRGLREVQPPRLAVDQLRRLNEFSQAMLDEPVADDRLRALCRLMIDPCFGGRWAVAVSTPVGAEPIPLCEIQHSSTADDPGALRLSRSLLRAADTRGEPVIATNRPGSTGPGGDFEMSIAPAVVVMAAVALPLASVSGENMGLLYAAFPPEYGTGEWLALCSLAVGHYRQAEAIWANLERSRKLATLEAELERGRRVQERLVPRRCDLPGLDVAIRFQACHGVGGDYVDALPLPNGSGLLVMADVSGKGLPAAMVAMGLHTVVHAAVRRWVSLADLAASLDAHLFETIAAETFVTLTAMTLDPVTGEITTINAGHPPAAAFSKTGVWHSVGCDGDMMLGPFEQTLTLMGDRLEPDETLMLYTDGCFEIFDAAGEMLGPGRLSDQAAPLVAGAPNAGAAADAVIQFLDHWQGAGEATDDRTLLMVRRRSN